MSEPAYDLRALAIGMASPSLARETVSRGAEEIERLQAGIRGLIDCWEKCKQGMPPTDYDGTPEFLMRRAKNILDPNFK